MAVALDRAVKGQRVVDVTNSSGVTQVDVAAVIQVSDRAVRGGGPATTSALSGYDRRRAS